MSFHSAPEKEALPVATHAIENDDQSDHERDWTQQEEHRLVQKLDRIIMPMLMLGFFGLQLDRGNIGNALTDHFLVDVGITQFQYNVGQQLLSLGIVLLEIPSNIVLYRVGPTIWIGGQIVAWGLVATFQAFIHGRGAGAYYATRLLLGLCEAGFIPAGLYTLTRWYKRGETSKRFSWYFIGNMLAGACSGLIAYGILHMRGICNLAGWQWMFLIEGIFTVVVGIFFLAFFPKSPSNPVSLLGLRYFNEREIHIISRRVLLDDPTKIHTHIKITKDEFKSTFTNWRLLPHMLMTITGMSPAGSMTSYGPTIINSFGYERLKSNAMASIGAWMLLVTNLLWGFLADRTQRRGIIVFLVLLVFWGFTVGNRVLITSADKELRFGILATSTAFSVSWHPVNGAWMASNARSAGERSITLAIFVMCANCSGIIGSQYFQAKDKPLYRTGWTIIVGMVSASLVLSAVANLQYYILNRYKKRNGAPKEEYYKY